MVRFTHLAFSSGVPIPSTFLTTPPDYTIRRTTNGSCVVRSIIFMLVAGSVMAAASIIPALSQAPKAGLVATAASVGEGNKVHESNEWTVGVAAGLLEGTNIRFAAEMAKVLDDRPNLRVLPMVTYGALGNVEDLLYLKGVDVTITSADVLEEF